MDQKLTASQINVVTNYVTNTENSCSYGILGSNMDLDVSKQGSGIKADTTNANGIAFVANTGDHSRC
jgi:hypothetical protein